MKKYLFCFFILIFLAGMCFFSSCSKNGKSAQSTDTAPLFEHNSEKTSLPSVDDFQAVKRGMTDEEVIGLVGKPLASGGSGILTWHFLLSDGTQRNVLFVCETDGVLRVTQIITYK